MAHGVTITKILEQCQDPFLLEFKLALKIFLNKCLSDAGPTAEKYGDGREVEKYASGKIFASLCLLATLDLRSIASKQ